MYYNDIQACERVVALEDTGSHIPLADKVFRRAQSLAGVLRRRRWVDRCIRRGVPGAIRAHFRVPFRAF